MPAYIGYNSIDESETDTSIMKATNEHCNMAYAFTSILRCEDEMSTKKSSVEIYNYTTKDCIWMCKFKRWYWEWKRSPYYFQIFIFGVGKTAISCLVGYSSSNSRRPMFLPHSSNNFTTWIKYWLDENRF